MTLVALSGCNSYIYEGLADFSNIDNKKKFNSFLICPKYICKKKVFYKESPVYGIPKEVLKKILLKEIITTPGVTIFRYNNHQYQFIQRSNFFKFQDIIDVTFYTKKGFSTYAMYSRSRFGI